MIDLKKPENVIDYLVTTNNDNYNYLKLIEELFELGDVITKTITKKDTVKQPPLKDLIGEMGDVVLRIAILCKTLNVEKEVISYVVDKLTNKFAGYIKEGKYIGRI